jgi:alpha-amylase
VRIQLNIFTKQRFSEVTIMKNRCGPLVVGIFLVGLLIEASWTQASTFVHLFEWTWEDIALECEDFLGPKGYEAVQISPPNEHRIILGRPWYERYQPMSYKLTSRSGTRAQFTDMVKRCHQAGVKIYADAVINHMASCRPTCDRGQLQFGTEGTAGSRYDPGRYEFADLFDPEDQGHVAGAVNIYHNVHFHRGCDGVTDWNNPWQVQNCELERLADLTTERDDVRSTIANYLAALFKLGVDGVRIDAAKHMPAADLHTILDKAAHAANVRIENTDIGPPGATATRLVFQEIIGSPLDRRAAMANGKITEFNYGPKLLEKVLHNHPQLWHLNGAVPFGEGWDLYPSSIGIAFLDNHDNQRGHGGGGAIIKDARNDLHSYAFANILMLSWPYGYPKVMSSYRFGSGSIWTTQTYPEQVISRIEGLNVPEDFQGPPHEQAHKADLSMADYDRTRSWHTRRVWRQAANGTWRNTCFDPGSPWMCEHRWVAIAGMVSFRKAVNANWDRVTNGWSNQGRQMAYGRGHLGFLVVNGQSGSSPNTLGPESNGWFQTGLPLGRYCDVVHTVLAADGTCRDGDGNAQEPIKVFTDGKAQFWVKAMDVVAIHVNARVGE